MKGPDDSALLEWIARAVTNEPSLAGERVDIGDWEAGEIGACTVVLPTAEEAQAYLDKVNDARRGSA